MSFLTKLYLEWFWEVFYRSFWSYFDFTYSYSQPGSVTSLKEFEFYLFSVKYPSDRTKTNGPRFWSGITRFEILVRNFGVWTVKDCRIFSECEIKYSRKCQPVGQHPFFLHPGWFTIRAGDDLVFQRVNQCQGKKKSKVRFTKVHSLEILVF